MVNIALRRPAVSSLTHGWSVGRSGQRDDAGEKRRGLREAAAPNAGSYGGTLDEPDVHTSRPRLHLSAHHLNPRVNVLLLPVNTKHK